MSDLSPEHQRKIRDLWSNTSKFRLYIEKVGAIKIVEADIILALTESTGKDLKELALEDWDSPSVWESIKDTSVVMKLPVILEIVEISESLHTYRCNSKHK